MKASAAGIASVPRGLLGAADADQVFAFDGGDADRNALAGSFDHLAVADVNTEVVNRVAEEDEVPDGDVGEAYAGRCSELFDGGAGNVHAGDFPRRLGKAGTIEPADAVSAPKVRFALVSKCLGDHCRCVRVRCWWC